MKNNYTIAGWLILLALPTLSLQPSSTFAQGTAIIYQGQLNANGGTANGFYDLQFVVWDALTSGNLIAGPLTNSATGVTNGLFTVTLDFGPGVFTGPPRWLELDVRTNGGGAFTPLLPRQQAMPMPYAIYAANAASASTATTASSVAATNIVGTVPLAKLPANVALLNSNQTFTGVNTFNTNVGIGIPAPFRSFQVHPAANQLLGIYQAGITVGSPTSGMSIESVNDANTANLPLEIRAAPIVLNVGNVGIGILNPTSALDVNGSVTLSGNLYLPATTATAGVIYAGGTTLIHSFGTYNFFAGIEAGNLTVSGPYNTGIGYEALSSLTTGDHNTAIGQTALFNNTSGNGNTAIGQAALFDNTTGSANTAIGQAALLSNTTGANNTADGWVALRNNTTGANNTANGWNALYSNTSGSNNAANGSQALYSNTTGFDNVANGYQALFSNTTGYKNTASGYQALVSNVNSYKNTAIGELALQYNTTGSENVAIGGEALSGNITGGGNTAVGIATLASNSSSSENTAIGDYAMYSNFAGSDNVAVGPGALQNAGTANFNTGVGYNALFNANGSAYSTAIGFRSLYSTSGTNNIGVGNYAGYNITTGSSNIDIGNLGLATDTNIIRIGSGQTRAFIAGVITGDGSGLTNLSVGQLPSAVLTNNETGVALSGTFIGDGSGLGNLNADQLSSGTIADSLLPPNVALLSGNQTFLNQTVFLADVGIGNSNPTNKLMVVNARCDGSSWINASDRNLKQDFARVDAQAVLARVAALPVQTWSYKAQPGQKHLGPVAQDFHAAFGLGADDVSIATVDESGVALAAIQGLNQKLNAKDAEIQELKARLEKLEQSLASRNGGGK